MQHFSQLVSVCLHSLFINGGRVCVRKKRRRNVGSCFAVGKVDAAVTTLWGRVGSHNRDISPSHSAV